MPAPSREEIWGVGQWVAVIRERWTFIAEVPKTSVGKFDKKVLRARFAEGELEVESVQATAGASG